MPYSHGKKLKPSLKLAKTISTSSFVSSTTSNSFSPLEDSTSASSSTSSSSSGKSVRFAAHLYTVKKFNTKLAPISISEKAASNLTRNLHNNAIPLTFPFIGGEDHRYSLDILDYSDLEYDNKDVEYDNESDVEDNAMLMHDRSMFIEKEILCFGEEETFDMADWKLVSNNLNPFKSDYKVDVTGLEDKIFKYLNGQNIKVHSLELSDPVSYEDICSNNFGNCQIWGLIFVNNLNFEKKIEIKFTLNNWADIHYINAHYNKSVTPHVDEFKFIIDISALKLNLISKNLIYANFFERKTTCLLNLQFCCRYDVNGFEYRSFYDNNDYKNYEITISLSAINLNRAVSNSSIFNSNLGPSKMRASNAEVTMSKNNENSKKPLRKFIKDTDYYNDSPLKHKFYQSFETKAACKTEPVSQTFKAETIDCEIEPFNYFFEPPDSQTNEDMSDSSYDLSLQDFNYWEFSNHGLGKALADSDILQFKNYPKPEPFSRPPIIDDTFTLNTDDRTLGSKTQKLEDNLAKEWKSAKTMTTLNETPLHDDEHRTSFTYTTWNNSTDTLMKRKEERPVESASCSQLSIATIKAEEDLLYQDYINSGRESSSPEISPLNNTTSLPFFPGDNMSDSSGEYEERTSLSPNKIHIFRDYFYKSPSP